MRKNFFQNMPECLSAVRLCVKSHDTTQCGIFETKVDTKYRNETKL